MDRFDFIEQKTLLLDNENIRDEKRIAHLKELCLDFETRKDEIKYLGLNPFDYTVSYYIGIDWLKENESYIVVHPKIEKLDYVQMFVHCLHHPEISKFLKDVYHVDFQKPLIEIPSSDWDLTPFLVVHFLSLVENIVKQGLKSNYIIHEENLNSKIKGKIAFSQQIKKNIVTKREDRVFCRFQEYSTNCFENRLLKKALLFIQKYTARHLDRAKYKTLFQKQNCLIAAFETVSDDPLISQLPTPGKIIEEKEDPLFDATVITLSNGIKVVLKQTDFKKDQILMTATRSGGTTLFNDKDIDNLKVINDVDLPLP